MQKRLIEAKGDHDEVSSHVVPHIEDALNLIDDLSQGFKNTQINQTNYKETNNKETNTQIFVTGSLHLIGGVLSFIHPDCYEKNPEDLKYESQIIEKYSKLGQ